MVLLVVIGAISLVMGFNLCDRDYRCPDGTTCCKNNINIWTCCPFSSGVCCPNTSTCCPPLSACVSQGNLVCVNDPYGFLSFFISPTLGVHPTNNHRRLIKDYAEEIDETVIKNK